MSKLIKLNNIRKEAKSFKNYLEKNRDMLSEYIYVCAEIDSEGDLVDLCVCTLYDCLYSSIDKYMSRAELVMNELPVLQLFGEFTYDQGCAIYKSIDGHLEKIYPTGTYMKQDIILNTDYSYDVKTDQYGETVVKIYMDSANELYPVFARVSDCYREISDQYISFRNHARERYTYRGDLNKILKQTEESMGDDIMKMVSFYKYLIDTIKDYDKNKEGK